MLPSNVLPMGFEPQLRRRQPSAPGRHAPLAGDPAFEAHIQDRALYGPSNDYWNGQSVPHTLQGMALTACLIRFSNLPHKQEGVIGSF